MLNIIFNSFYLFLLGSLHIFSQQNIINQDSTKTFPILTLESLLNCSYQIGYSEDDPIKIIKLKDGNCDFSKEVISKYGTSGTFLIWYDKHISCELNSDSLIDAIIILKGKFGGTGVDPYVFPVLNVNGEPSPLKPFLLDDRVKIEKIYKKKSLVYLDLIVHDKGDGLCCPTKKETWKLKLKKNEFVRIN
ncbi:MAG: hypothetical protein WAU11_01160 [Ignavibacteriaceae bacterium]|jgi:hypothetical protein